MSKEQYPHSLRAAIILYQEREAKQNEADMKRALHLAANPDECTFIRAVEGHDAYWPAALRVAQFVITAALDGVIDIEMSDTIWKVSRGKRSAYISAASGLKAWNGVKHASKNG